MEKKMIKLGIGLLIIGLMASCQKEAVTPNDKTDPLEGCYAYTLFDLYVYNVENQIDNRIGQSSVIGSIYAFTPDSERIIFNTKDSTCFMNIDGSNHVLLPIALESTQFSPDGQSIIYVQDGDVFKMEISTNNITQLTNSDNAYWHPVLSPDGQKIVCCSDNGLCVVTIEGTVTNFSGANSADWYDWSYDSKEIVYSKSATEGSAQIFKYNIETEVETQLTSTNKYNYSPRWHPSQKKIIFTSITSDYGSDLIIMDSDATNQTSIFHQDFIGSPCFSPNGNQVTFINDTKIAMIDADGENYHVINEADASSLRNPVWSPDGKYILYSKGVPFEMPYISGMD